MSNPLLTASEQAHINAVRSYHHTSLDSTVSTTLSALVDRVDWNKLFLRAAIAFNAVGLLYVSSIYRLRFNNIPFKVCPDVALDANATALYAVRLNQQSKDKFHG